MGGKNSTHSLPQIFFIVLDRRLISCFKIMSQHSYAQQQLINCPYCQHQFEADIWLIINIKQEPDLVKKIKQNSFNQLSCPSCSGVLQAVDAPLLLYRPDDTPHLLFSPAQGISQEVKSQLVERLRDNLGIEWQDNWLQRLQEIPKTSLPVVFEQGLDIALKQIQQKLEEGVSGLIENLININTEEENEKYWQILGKLLQAEWNCDGESEIVWSVIEQYRDRFNDNFVLMLQQWTNQQFAELSSQPQIAEMLAEILEKLCVSIFNFSGGCSSREYQVLITVSQIVLAFRTQTKNFEKQAQNLNYLGAAYLCLVEKSIDEESNLRKAIYSYQESTYVYRHLHLNEDLSTSLHNLGIAYRYLADIPIDEEFNLQQAISYHKQSAEICQQLNLIKDLSNNLLNIGVAYCKLAIIGIDKESNLRKGIDYYKKSINIATKLSLTKVLCLSLHNLGNAYDALAKIGTNEESDLRKAIDYYQQSTNICWHLDLKEILSSNLSYLGNAYSKIAEIAIDKESDLRKAIDYYQQSNDMRTELGLDKDFAHTLNNLGFAYFKLSGIVVNVVGKEFNLRRAIDYYQQSADMRTQLGLHEDFAHTLNNLGFTYLKLSGIVVDVVDEEFNLRRAIDYYQQSADMRTQLGLHEDFAHTLNNLGFVYFKLSGIVVDVIDEEFNLRRAIDYYQESADIYKKLNLEQNLSHTLNNLDTAYYHLNKITVNGKYGSSQDIDNHQQYTNILAEEEMTDDTLIVMLHLAKRIRVATLIENLIHIDIKEVNDEYLKILGEILQAQWKYGNESKIVWSVIEQYQDRFDDSFILALEQWINRQFTELADFPIVAEMLSKLLENFCISIFNYPKGCSFYENKVIIAISQISLEFHIQTNNLDKQAQDYHNLASAHCKIAEIGIDAELNLRKGIDYYQQSADIRMQLGLNQDLSYTLISLGDAYVLLAMIGIDAESNLRKGIDYYQQSADIRMQLGLEQELSYTFIDLGIAYCKLAEIGIDTESNLYKAIDYHQQSANISTKLGLDINLFYLRGLGSTYFSLAEIGIDIESNLYKAIDYHQQSVNISTKLGFSKILSETFNSLGIAYFRVAEFGIDEESNLYKAIDYFQQSANIYKQLKLDFGLSYVLNNLGHIYCELAENGIDVKFNLKESIDYCQQSADICTQLGLHNNLSFSLMGLGHAYFTQARIGMNMEANLQKAINYYQQSADIKTNLGSIKDLSFVLINLGFAYRDLSKFGIEREYNLYQAVNAHQQSIHICKQLELNYYLSISLNHLGVNYIELAENGIDVQSNLYKGIDYYQQSADICIRLALDRNLILVLNNLGNAYIKVAAISLDKKQYLIKAFNACQKSTDICIQLGLNKHLSNSLSNLGCVYYELTEIGINNEYNLLKAMDCFRQALDLLKSKHLPIDCLKSGCRLGNLAFKQGWWKIALEGYEIAVSAVEQIRRWGKDDKHRQEILAEGISIYDRALQCYINLGEYQQAILLTERARSRHLVELIYSNDLYKYEEIDPTIQPYLEEYENIQSQINIKQLQEQSDNFNKVISANKKLTRTETSFEELEVTLENLHKQKDEIWLEIRKRDKVLADGLEVPYLSFDSLQKLIANSPKTALLSFYSTEEQTYIFVLRHCQSNTRTSYEISLQLHICKNEDYENLQNFVRKQWLNPYKEFKQEASQNWLQPEQIETTLQKVADKLNINDLIDNHLQNIEELILIPHIFLHLIPFAALPVNSVESSTDERSLPQKYLSDLFYLRVVPSAQILSYCQEREENNPYPIVEGKKYATIENATDNLCMASYECEQISQLLGIPEIQRFIGKQNAIIKNYRGLTQNPELRGLHSSHHAVSVLDKPLESALNLGDGSLTLGQLISPGWRMPHLVEIFLSCCETNLGNPNITDDILTLSTGFLCAGARSVISTLWSVNDLATAFFCLFYYQYRKNGENRSKAIQLAQQDLRSKTGEELDAQFKVKQIDKYLFKLQQQAPEQSAIEKIDCIRGDLKEIKKFPKQKIFESPYYWAGFVCQGLR
ncbi:TPR repeat-containing protein [Calothrix parasitica NIES-267]|uniref:TPR repeat-containing protein n=1 Tax=Calothrix parasitica NIES-267 TaxID=1973488 RepID=A0A1Z4LTX6_9CYAN|nr:TPR repeat-containing protein [Calothrix parasitica NIES-267]